MQVKRGVRGAGKAPPKPWSADTHRGGREYALSTHGINAKLKLRTARAMAMETAETARAKQQACAVIYAEGTVIRLGEGRVGIYIDSEFRDGLAPLLGQRVRLLVLGVARQRGGRGP